MDDFCIWVPATMNTFSGRLRLALHGAWRNYFYDRLADVAAFGRDRHQGWAAWIGAAVSGQQSALKAAGGLLEQARVLMLKIVRSRQNPAGSDDSGADPECCCNRRGAGVTVTDPKTHGTDQTGNVSVGTMVLCRAMTIRATIHH